MTPGLGFFLGWLLGSATMYLWLYLHGRLLPPRHF